MPNNQLIDALKVLAADALRRALEPATPDQLEPATPDQPVTQVHPFPGCPRQTRGIQLDAARVSMLYVDLAPMMAHDEIVDTAWAIGCALAARALSAPDASGTVTLWLAALEEAVLWCRGAYPSDTSRSTGSNTSGTE
jgi:hypothetical protein